MPKRTLLDMTQNILAEMESDQVNSLTDTPEAEAVGKIIETIYYDLIANQTFPEHRELFQFTALADSDKPNYLQYPATVTNIEWFKYDSRDSASDTAISYKEVVYMDPTAFIGMLNSRDSSTTEVDSISDDSSITLLIKNDANPTYWTSFDDDYIICDSYESTIDSTLQASKTQGWGKIEPTFTQSDAFVPDLDLDLFPMLLAVSKSAAFASQKGQNPPVVSAAARSHIVKNQNNRHRLNMANTYNQPNYGRK